MKLRILWILCLFVLLGGVLPVQASGLILHVNITTDAVDANPGDGVCETATGNGLCSLRAAVMEANASVGEDTIILPEDNFILTLGGQWEDSAATGDLDITSNLSITGSNAETTIIDGNLLDRVFQVIGQSSVSFSDFTVTNGRIVQNDNYIKTGTAILNEGTLTLNRLIVRDNTFIGPIEGTVYNRGSLSIENSTFLNNRARGGGAVFNSGGSLFISSSLLDGNKGELTCGGGIYNADSGNATVQNTTIIQNIAGGNCGGGIFNSSGILIVEDSVIKENEAQGSGGGIHNNGTVYVYNTTIIENLADRDEDEIGSGGGIANYDGEIFVYQSLISNNTAMRGGGIFNNGNYDSLVVLVNSTVSGNQAFMHGGGIFTGSNIASETMVTQLYNSTVSDNTAHSDLNPNGGDGGGIYNQTYAHFHLQNSLIANNHDLDLFSNMEPEDCFGPVTSEGFNLLGIDYGCAGLIHGVNGDQVGTISFPLDPLIGLLSNNGGSTHTHALLAGSPAIDAGNPSGCLDDQGLLLTNDQRYYSRTVDGDNDNVARCDIGAFEYGALPPTPTTTPTPTATFTPTPTPTASPPGSAQEFQLFIPFIDR